MTAKNGIPLALLLLVTLRAHAAPDDGGGSPPAPAASRPAWLFSWTNNPGALTDAPGHVQGQLDYSTDCVNKVAASVQAGSDQSVANCEGSRMAAGPGIYACDNPFTSHDYGSTLIVMRSKGGDSNLVNTTGTVAQASSGVDRSIYGNPSTDAILYDFRSTDAGGLALAVRKAALLDNSQTYALKVPSAPPKEFHFHDPFACTPQTPLRDILAHWGDQLDFMALTFDSFRDPAAQNFERNGQLNDAGLAAALASNVVAVPDADLRAKIAKVTAHSPRVAAALSDDSCAEAEHVTARMCLAYELFDSLTGNMGTNDYPTHAWPYPTLVKALTDLSVLFPSDMGKFHDQDSLLKYLAARFLRDSHQAQRAQEAFDCMRTVKQQLAPGNFSSWTPVPPSAAADASPGLPGAQNAR